MSDQPRVIVHTKQGRAIDAEPLEHPFTDMQIEEWVVTIGKQVAGKNNYLHFKTNSGRYVVISGDNVAYVELVLEPDF